MDLKKAQDLHRLGQFSQAEAAYNEILESGTNIQDVLQCLIQLYGQINKPELAVNCLNRLIELSPQQLATYDYLAELLSKLDRRQEAADCYLGFLENNRAVDTAWFNYAWRLRQAEDYKGALVAYDQALALGISGSEEVYLNKAVILSDHLRQEDQAIACLQQALSINPNYTSALFNLGNLKEETGDRNGALMLFKKVLSLDPDNFEALSRLADIETFSSVSDPIIQRMKQAVRVPDVHISTKANLFFALGKSMNDCGSWDDAFHYYVEGNKINQRLLGQYDAKGHTKLIDSIISTFSTEWFHKVEPVSDFAPIFICGMFRSGSTLIEQVLAGHPNITAGGERDFFPRAIMSYFSPYPSSVLSVEPSVLNDVAHNYEQDLLQTFGAGTCITDKRPDNFLYLGLIKTLFPKARIIFTSRDARDNCLSVFFQRLGKQMLYANDLDDLVHFYKEHLRLMEYWKTIFGENIHTLHYDSFIEEPEKVMRELFGFLDLKWHAGCLDFHEMTNHVKTASVWQVRQPLHQKSSGRWKNYEPHIASLLQALPSN